ncbi:unnamed protein product [Prorocentrum cordatum]|uniref:Major facilitator superfamily associated domain-containing protein n=1 Tax=Prorocentrum cordatum TaxID=2364126 RepID=A0ABN9S1B8_9DINO|nr:unnamed protein product [Polarella glacialis]
MGLILCLNPALRFLAQQVWATLCDWLGSYKEVVTTSTLTGLVLANCLMIPAVKGSFPFILAASLSAGMFMAAWGSVTDSMTIQVLKEYEEAHKATLAAGDGDTRGVRLPSFGQQRLWGALGWGVASLAGGAVMDAFGVSTMFMSADVLLLLMFVIVLTQFPSKKGSRARAGRIEWGALARFEVVWFLANLVVYGLHMSLVESFLFVFLLREFKGATSLLCGATIAVMCLFEMPVFFFFDRLLSRFQLTTLLSFCHLVFAVRCLAYAILPRDQPWAVLVVEPLHGLTFALMWLAPPGAEARMQAAMNGLYFLMSLGCGSLLWGHATEPAPRGLGFTTCFKLAACTMLTWACVWALGWQLLGCRRARLARQQARLALLEPGAPGTSFTSGTSMAQVR